MRKIFFLFGLLAIINIFYWVDNYYKIKPAERARFIGYVGGDLRDKFVQSKRALRAIPDTLNSILDNRSALKDIPSIQIQLALESHYLLEGEYPEKLETVVDVKKMSRAVKREYWRTKSGYFLRILSKNGELIEEIEHEAE